MEKMTLKQLQEFFISTYGNDYKQYGITKSAFNNKKQLLIRLEDITNWRYKADVLSKKA